MEAGAMAFVTQSAIIKRKKARRELSVGMGINFSRKEVASDISTISIVDRKCPLPRSDYIGYVRDCPFLGHSLIPLLIPCPKTPGFPRKTS